MKSKTSPKATAAELAGRESRPKTWTLNDPLISGHPAYQRLRPDDGSQLADALLKWASNVASIEPVETKLMTLRTELAKVEDEKRGITWASDAAVLIRSDPAACALARLVSLSESELAKRRGWVISAEFDVGRLWKSACVLLCDLAGLSNENLPSELSPAMRKAKVLSMRASLRELVGKHGDDLVANAADRRIAYPSRFDV